MWFRDGFHFLFPRLQDKLSQLLTYSIYTPIGVPRLDAYKKEWQSYDKKPGGAVSPAWPTILLSTLRQPF